MVRYHLYIIMFVFIQVSKGVNEILQHAISFRLFETLIIFGTPHYDLRQVREGPRIGLCLWAPRLRRDATVVSYFKCVAIKCHTFVMALAKELI